MTRYEFYEPNDGTTTDATIAHFGVKGMKWGVRKDRVKGGVRKFKENYKKNRQAELDRDAARLRKVGLNKVADRVEKTPLEGYEIAAARAATRKLGASAKKASDWAKKNPDKATMIVMTAVAIPAYAVGVKLALDSSSPGGSARAASTAGRMVRGKDFTMADPKNTRYMLKNADKWLYK